MRQTSARPLVAVVLVVISGALPVFLVGGVSVQMRHDLDFGEAALGVAFGVFFVAAALTSAVLGRVAERLGPHRSMRASAASSALVLLAIAVLARSYPALVALLALGGTANALAQPAANVFLARTVPPSRLGIAFALKQSGIPASTLLGGLAVPALALTVGWRWAFVAGSLMAAVGVLLVAPAAPPTRATDAAARPRARLALGPLAVLGVGIGFGAAAAGSLGAFLVNAAVAAGMAEGTSGVLVSVGSATCIAVRLVAGARADKRGSGHLLRVAAMLVLGSAAFAAYATQRPLVLVVVTPLAFGAGWGWPGLFNLAIVRANPDAPGVASGITQTGTYFGAMAGPVLFGAVAERWSYASAWWLASGLALAAAATITAGRVLLRRDRERDRARAEDEAASSAVPA